MQQDASQFFFAIILSCTLFGFLALLLGRKSAAFWNAACMLNLSGLMFCGPALNYSSLSPSTVADLLFLLTLQNVWLVRPVTAAAGAKEISS
ncbi:MAG: hypothetical protein ACXVA9_10450 [Bdellovibrionales bacterium]